MTRSLKIAGLLLALALASAAQQKQAPSTQPAEKTPAVPKTPPTTAPQTTAPKSSVPVAPKKDPTAGWHKFCPPEGDYCVKYPANWEALGDTADSGGIVIAPPQANKPSARWSSITVAATDIPPAPPGKQRASFDELIALVLDSMQPGTEPRTLERRQTSIDDLPAQVLKISYTDESGVPWIEDIAMMDADDVIYSVALRCTPDELPSLEPTFKQILETWVLIEPDE